MKIHTKDFRVREGDEVDLEKWPTKVDAVYKSKEQYQKLLEEHVAQLSLQQQLLYSTNRHAILLIFQAMDAAGKDGAIRHVMSGVNPQGCQVFSFKHPSAGELEHDFLWRTSRDLQILRDDGRIGSGDRRRELAQFAHLGVDVLHALAQRFFRVRHPRRDDRRRDRVNGRATREQRHEKQTRRDRAPQCSHCGAPGDAGGRLRRGRLRNDRA